MSLHDTNEKPDFDAEITAIAEYVKNYTVTCELAYNTAYLCFLDTLACGFMALKHKHCLSLMGPVVPGATMSGGVKVPGTHYELDPVQGAFNIGTMIRYLDFNDTWLAAEWGHPSDNLGGILATADYLSRQHNKTFTIYDILTAMIKAHEIQGVMALENSFNKIGLDHVLLVKLASTAVVADMLECNLEQTKNAISLAMVDGQSLRTYRHAPNAGARKSWAAGDATSRAVRLALLAKQDEPGYPSALSAKRWGFYDVLFGGKPFQFQRDYGAYVMENILFKVSFPAEFHAQTAVECAVRLHDEVKARLDDIERIDLMTHRSAIDIISKQGPLHNYADRDHCLQYMVAIALIFGDLNAEHYSDEAAKDPRINALREKMHVDEDAQMSADYYDPDKRAIANALKITFKDGTQTELVRVDYPIGHKRRRDESLPLLKAKFEKAINTHFNSDKAQAIIALANDKAKLLDCSVSAWMDLISL